MPYCSNKKCNPMMPLFGTVSLVRKYWQDLRHGKCPKCKSVYDIEIMTDGKHKLLVKGLQCPKCKVGLKPERRWHLQCPKCKTNY